MKEIEFRNYNRILADVPFGNYKFAKSPHVDISLSQIITKSDPGDVMRIHTPGSVQKGLESSVSSSAGLGWVPQSAFSNQQQGTVKPPNFYL